MLYLCRYLLAHRVDDYISLASTSEHVAAIRAHSHRFHLIMDRLQSGLVRLIYKVNHPHRIVILDQIHVGSRARPNLHLQADGLELDPLDHLVQLEVADEKVVALADVADVAGKVVVEEDALRLVLVAHLVVDQVALGQRVVVIEGVDSLGLCEAVVDVLLHVEAVHEDESRRVGLVEELLFERVAVLSVVDQYFAICGSGKPLVIRL